ncbi:50S ribosomal protein L29 [Mycoplasma iguanae]|uniref:Large ribosomal subunit protein uL29 n=1 Tax=Mycoplasma iguanae TaxID=292461 RepID=A0ABY5R8F4_9MOLU|nr:50S ribosomal protein L29 [Mycoplasma iguanae]UVD81786.1 50S ribosomal protein L29 [Mycoplasma iguanae]
MLFKNLKEKSLPELAKLVEEYKAELFTLRFKNTTGQQDKTHKINAVKKDIAKALTAIKQKSLESQTKVEGEK